jgi:hypothetical protein
MKFIKIKLETPVQFFGYKTDGIWTSQAEIDAAVAGGLTTSNIQKNALIPGGF